MKKMIQLPLALEEIQLTLDELTHDYSSIEIQAQPHNLCMESAMLILKKLPSMVTTLIIRNGCLIGKTTQEIIHLIQNIPSHIKTLNLSGNMLGSRDHEDLTNIIKNIHALSFLSEVRLNWNEIDSPTVLFLIDELNRSTKTRGRAQQRAFSTEWLFFGNTLDHVSEELVAKMVRKKIFLSETGNTQIIEEKMLQEIFLEDFPQKMMRYFDMRLYQNSLADKNDLEWNWYSMMKQLVHLSVRVDIFTAMGNHLRVSFPALESLSLYATNQLSLRKYHADDQIISFSEQEPPALSFANTKEFVIPLHEEGFSFKELKSLEFLGISGTMMLDILEHGCLKNTPALVNELIQKNMQFSIPDLQRIQTVFQKFTSLQKYRFEFHNYGDTEKFCFHLGAHHRDQVALIQILDSIKIRVESIEMTECPWRAQTILRSLYDQLVKTHIGPGVGEFLSSSLCNQSKKLCMDHPLSVQHGFDFNNIFYVNLKFLIDSDKDLQDITGALTSISESSNVQCVSFFFRLTTHQQKLYTVLKKMKEQVYTQMERHFLLKLEFCGMIPVFLPLTYEIEGARFYELDPDRDRNAQFIIEEFLPSMPRKVRTITFRDQFNRNRARELFYSCEDLPKLFHSIPHSVKKIFLQKDSFIANEAHFDFTSHGKEWYFNGREQYAVRQKWHTELKKIFNNGRLEIIGFFSERIMGYLSFFHDLFRSAPRENAQGRVPPLPAIPIELAFKMSEYLVEKQTQQRINNGLQSINHRFRPQKPL